MADRPDTKTLFTKEIPDYDPDPKNGTIIRVEQYKDKRPSVVVERWYTDRESVKKIVPFVNLSTFAVRKVMPIMAEVAKFIDDKFPTQKKNTPSTDIDMSKM